MHTKETSTLQRAIQFAAGLGTIVLAIIAIFEYRKKSSQYDLQEKKSLLDIEKAKIELDQIKGKLFVNPLN
jgi:hypothetical protein